MRTGFNYENDEDAKIIIVLRENEREKKRGDGPGFKKQNMLQFQNSTNRHLCWASPPVIHLKILNF